MADIDGPQIERKRGDTAPDVVNVRDADDGGPLDITGFSYTLTVSEFRAPTTEPPLVTVAGTVTDSINGRVEFNWSALQANLPPGKFFYDVQQVDVSSRIKTIAKGKYVIHQDITKN